MKIGIFGGSFNPPHNMHLQIALNLIQNHYVEKIIFVPTGNDYPKKELIEATHRFEMIKQMIKPYPNLEVSNYEIQNHSVPTFQTLHYYQQKCPHDQIYFICGTDNLKELHTWKNYTNILTNYKILVIQRNKTNLTTILNQYHDYQENIIPCNISSIPISSTQIRNLIKENVNSQEIALFLPKEVLQYIQENNLYQEKEQTNERNYSIIKRKKSNHLHDGILHRRVSCE